MKKRVISNIISVSIGAVIAVPLCVCAAETQQEGHLFHEREVDVMDWQQAAEEEDIEEEIYQGELQLLACLVMAEAQGEDFIGKRLVVDAVLNRVDSPEYPNTITDVIFDSNQFTPVIDGSLERAFGTVTQDCFDAVSAELEKRLDDEIMFFQAGSYSQYGEAAYQWGRHYFSY